MADKSATMTAGPLALEDAVLVRQVQEGNMAAFSRLVAKYQDRVVNVCWRVCGNPDEAQDLAQETFLHALDKIGTFRAQASFYTWLFRIAVNQALSYRRKARRLTLSFHDGDGEWRDGVGTHPAGSISGDADEPLARLAARELSLRLAQALEALDDDHRAVVVLRDIESLDYQEIAQVLDINLGTVKSRLHRARMALRDMINRMDEKQ